MTRLIAALLGASLSALTAPPVIAQASTSPGVNYRLDDGSTFQRGCFDPCACPAGPILPIQGTFRLTPTSSDPLFDHYAVTNVEWMVRQPDGSTLSVAGSGTFKIGGEVAITEELSLDLVVGSEAVQHFDSGVVAPPVQFPLLDLTISIHGMYCYDTVIRVRARPFPRLDVERDAIAWDSDPPATFYDVVRGDLGTLRVTGGNYRVATEQCVTNDRAALSVPFTLSPAAGDGYWFLLRTKGGSYDAWDSMLAASRDLGINAARGSCP
jgi:hypothetical protein